MAGTRARILVVDDEPNITTLLSSTLRLVDLDVRQAHSGREALASVDSYDPHLVLLDVMLPDLDGLEVARRLRAAERTTPILFLTARGGVDDRVAGLTAGGDDYVAKPFSLEEVVLRVRAILRRSGPAEGGHSAVVAYADLTLDEDAHEVRRAGRLVDLSPTEFKLLRFLLTNAGHVMSKAQILDRVWSYEFDGSGAIVESYVYTLRKKLDALGPPLIQTVRGVGYTVRERRS
ncbi:MULTISPECIES: response regulator transcription factor [Mumia]|uniref:response regulator transcription factor n=1 Tax=Mumia TaxID=1546255 RepID=UPI00141EC03E|nr:MULTISPECIES: response regulator transcription factor [unclassified Mumia]QMW65012.1 response regulator transcription factor [Mumia sp. ZJ1417]